MVRAQRQECIDRVSSDVPAHFGGRLVCLALYGSAAGDGFNPQRSDLNFAIVLDRVSFDDLKAVQTFLPAWHRLGAATPLLIDRDFLQHARDVFPIELADIQAQHRVLAGEDIFSSMRLEPSDLRRELEQEGRAKLLRLRVQYAETAGRKRDLEALMTDSVGAIVVILRGVLRLHPAPVPEAPLAVLQAFTALTGEHLEGVRRVVSARDAARWDGEADAVFRDYLGDVERIVGVIDGLRFDTAPKVGE